MSSWCHSTRWHQKQHKGHYSTGQLGGKKQHKGHYSTAQLGGKKQHKTATQLLNSVAKNNIKVCCCYFETKIPVELLQRIFELTKPYTLRRDLAISPWHLGQLNRRTRAVASSLPRLWSDIQVD
ncbi:hypothetical protein B0H17DRAFT_1103917 [Mycena rosella]|uniref:F-box domain-containing protein n=1 Tax=Mycena rosella TaxID=1033263 RepID=A0AAD7CD60_MYCRO|nr:hypothetical protein B0H17DRAFT_1103917 [Mycena rosella]